MGAAPEPQVGVPLATHLASSPGLNFLIYNMGPGCNYPYYHSSIVPLTFLSLKKMSY